MGIRVGRLDGRDVRMSWEDVALIIMGPRSNKTSALAVPAVRAAPGLAVATSNKADLWALTSAARAELGPVWVFDPQDIAFHPQRWWWDPLRAIREVPDPHRVEAATRLAGHFMATIGGTRRDPFFHAAGNKSSPAPCSPPPSTPPPPCGRSSNGCNSGAAKPSSPSTLVSAP